MATRKQRRFNLYSTSKICPDESGQVCYEGLYHYKPLRKKLWIEFRKNNTCGKRL